jgi:hypothetical protein
LKKTSEKGEEMTEQEIAERLEEYFQSYSEWVDAINTHNNKVREGRRYLLDLRYRLNRRTDKLGIEEAVMELQRDIVGKHMTAEYREAVFGDCGEMVRPAEVKIYDNRGLSKPEIF